MTNKTFSELISYIRFQLSQMGAKNDFHRFEHLCRAFARLKLCERILPATGPVSSGGDQGRDFENYRSYLSSTPIVNSTLFLGGKAGKDKIVFACSLQKGIAPKIKKDLGVIFGSSEKIKMVYYFCETDLPVGRRHNLQKYCRENYGAELEIFDGQALSEALVDTDVFWIAQEYLNIPADMYPRLEIEDPKYAEQKEYWDSENLPYSHADFLQIKRCMCHAACNKNEKPDLNFWIQKMEHFLNEDHLEDLRRRASYELCIIALRGQNRLTDRRDLVISYFSSIDQLEGTSEFQDAVRLLSFCSAAHRDGHFDIDPAVLFGWTTQLISRIDIVLKNTNANDQPGLRCSLLQERGCLELLPYRDGTTCKPFDISRAISFWSRMINLVEKASLFPLENFADCLTSLVEFEHDNEEFIDLCSKINELLTKRTSGNVAAEKCRDRALVCFRKEKYVSGIYQLQKSKISWFSAETLTGSILSMILLSEMYSRLGLFHAAKYYALGAAYLAYQNNDDDHKKFVPVAIFKSASFCYAAGEYASFLQFVDIALYLHHKYDDDPLDCNKHEDLEYAFIHSSIIRTITKKFDMSLFKSFEKIIKKWPIDDELRKELNKIVKDKKNVWQNCTFDKFMKTIESENGGKPYEDLGVKRTIQWSALGITWKVSFNNQYLDVIIAEQFVAILQIIQVDLARIDLCLLPTTIEINCIICSESEPSIQEKPNNNTALWEISFPQIWIDNPKHADNLQSHVFAFAATVLGHSSVLSFDKFHSILNRAFEEGLSDKTFNVRSYSKLFSEFLPKSTFEEFDRTMYEPLGKDYLFSTTSHNELAWIDDPAPNYTLKKSECFIARRYDKAIKPVCKTLDRLNSHEPFKEVVKQLRNEGLPDWRILILIANVVTEYRAKQILPDKNDLPALKTLVEEFARSEENEFDPIEIPLSLFSYERLLFRKPFANIATAGIWELEIHSKTPDFVALEHFLNARYKNSSDDIKHEPIFNVD